MAFNLSNVAEFIPELNSKGLYLRLTKRIRKSLPWFKSSRKREIRQFQVVIVQRRQRNVHEKRDARANLLFC